MPLRTSPTPLSVPREPRAAPQPRLRRRLPQLVTDILQSGREAGRPYHYTTRDVRAIVQYVSEAPRVTPGAFTPTNWDEVDARQARHRSSVVVETRLDTAAGDGGGEGDDDVGEDRAHGADVKSNARYLARNDKFISMSKEYKVRLT